MKLNNLKDWLNWIQSLHVKEMDLSLERVREVASRLDLLHPESLVVTVGGTNGKGSTVAGLDAIYVDAGYRVGTFTSPYLFRYNEQVCIQGRPVSDDLLCDAFSKIKAVLGDITLTQFEFGALAAFIIFKEAKLDVWILEVGLGGRFDAVNVLNADLAIVTSIALDHTAVLGDTREAIGYQKAGIFREKKPAVCGDLDPPWTLESYANEVKADLFCQGKEFGFEKKESSWNWWGLNVSLENLPIPPLMLQNMSTVLMAIHLLLDELPVPRAAMEGGLKKAALNGRIQVFPSDVTQIFDVAHNPSAVEMLTKYLEMNLTQGKTHAVFSMLSDKDIPGSIEIIKKK